MKQSKKIVIKPRSKIDLLEKKKLIFTKQKISKKKIYPLILVLGGAVLLLIVAFIYLNKTNTTNTKVGESRSLLTKSSVNTNNNTSVIGFDHTNANYDTTSHILQKDQNIKPYLLALGLTDSYVEAITYEAKQKGLLQFLAGGTIRLLHNDKVRDDKIVVYRDNPNQSWVLKTFPSPAVTLLSKKATTRIVAKGGIIKTSFLEAVWENNMPPDLMAKIESALQWSIDLHHTAIGDQFKVVYEESSIDDKVIGTEKLLAIQFIGSHGNLLAYFFDGTLGQGFFNIEGQNIEQRFLKSPIKYGIISSPYKEKRLHPVDKVVKGHWGTDYAAPEGTPIRAVADGIIEMASFTKNSGNYIKIKHDQIYQTQYLHLQGFAKGIKKGVTIKQGQTIGFVGMTGKTTGPHVCFRFGKNGKQVDHLKEKVVTKQQLLAISDQQYFLKTKDTLNTYLRNVNLFSDNY